MNKIDLDYIISQMPRINIFSNNSSVREEVKRGMKEAIHQALVLASEVAPIYDEQGEVTQDKQSILDVEKLIK